MSVVTAFIERLFGKERLSYRSLLVFGIGTALLWVDKLESAEWVALAVAFVIGEAAYKAFGRAP